MSSKPWRHLLRIGGQLGLFALLFSITACAMKFTGEPDPTEKAALQPQMDLGDNTSQCLSGYADKAVAYFNGELSEQSTADFWDCAAQSLTLFSSKTKGASADAYAPSELQHFLEKYFLAPNEKIPDGLVREAMLIKKVFVGGSSTQITRDEIKKTIDWVQTFKTESLRIRPYLPFSLEKIAKLPDSHRAQMRAELMNVAGAAGDALSKTVESYPFDSLSRLLDEFSTLYANQSEIVEKIQNFKKQLPVAALIKSLFVSSGRDVVRTSDWKIILERGVDAAFFYADLQKDWGYLSESPELVDNAQNISNQGFKWMQIAIANQPNNQIDFSIFRELLNWVGESRIQAWIGKPVRLETIQKSLETLVVKLLGGAVAKTAFPDAAKASGLTRPVLDYFQAEINQMILIQKSLYKFQHMRPDFLPPVDSPLEKEILDLINKRPTLFSSDNHQEVIFSAEKMTGAKKIKDLIQLNWMRTATRMIFRAYSKDTARSSQLTGITIDELDELYLDFWGLGTEMKGLDSRTKMAARKRFLETNLFGFTANGDDFLNFEEMIDLMTYILSSKNFSMRMYEGTQRLCADPEGEKDPLYSLPQLKVNCFRSVFPKLLLVFTEDTMPALSKYMSGLDQDQQKEALLYLEMAGRFIGATQTPVEAGDFDGFAMVLNYVESFFFRFDVDRNNILDQTEILAGLPLFHKELAKMIEKSTGNKASDSQVEAIFTYMLKYGQAPTKSGLVWWMTRRGVGLGGVEADRLRILKILASLTAPIPLSAD